MPDMTLTADDAAELADFLGFLRNWVTAGRDQLSGSLAPVQDGHSYDAELLRHDLARFRSMLGGTGGDNGFLRPSRRTRRRRG
jgi:hypothetical protein